MTPRNDARPRLGAGVGLRVPHYDHVLEHWPALGFVEVISENFFGEGGRPRAVLRAVRDRYPVALHGVSMGIGRTDDLDERYLCALQRLVAETDPIFVSDHLCWTGVQGLQGHDLWPLPYTEEALTHLRPRIDAVQERLGRRFYIENLSTYLQFAQSEMAEWTFLAELVDRTGCGLLLDVNNVFVSARNHGFDPIDYLRALPAQAVGYMHLAGHEEHPRYILDTHDHPIREEVWSLFDTAAGLTGCPNVSVERDDHVPPWADLAAEVHRAAAVLGKHGIQISAPAP